MPVAIPPWIKAAEPAEWYLKGLSLAEAQRRTDAEMQLQREQMERAILEQRARLNVEQEYHRQVADLRREELASEERRQQQAMAVQQARNEQMAQYQNRMTAINLARAQRELEASGLNSKKWAEISAARQAIPIRAKELEAAGMNRDEALRQASLENLDAFGTTGFSSLFNKGGGGPDWWTKTDVGDLMKERARIRKDLDNPDLDRTMEKKLTSDLEVINRKIESYRPNALNKGSPDYTWDPLKGLVSSSDSSVVVPGMQPGEMVTDRDTGLPTLPQFSGGLAPNVPLPATLPAALSILENTNRQPTLPPMVPSYIMPF